MRVGKRKERNRGVTLPRQPRSLRSFLSTDVIVKSPEPRNPPLAAEGRPLAAPSPVTRWKIKSQTRVSGAEPPPLTAKFKEG
ncbi:hypothetical protein O3P69_011012 [Scylla paramamosain]|uniref:Uncharacterized protein n=1 Tax=Scylla paramamosain TaxID=85552 RepID=A0AAW0SD32_SCYPA